MSQKEKSEFIVTYPAYSLKSLLVNAESAVGDDNTHHWIDGEKIPKTALGFMDHDYYLERRYKLENNHAARHPIPYCLITRPGEEGDSVTDVFVYQRTKRTGEGRLAGQHSIGVGGHVEAADVSKAVIEGSGILSSIRASLIRELDEEFNLMNSEGTVVSFASVLQTKDISIRGLIHGYEGVDMFHLGLVIEIKLPGYGYEIGQSKEADSLAVGFYRSTHLKTCEHYKNMESWTKIIIDRLGY